MPRRATPLSAQKVARAGPGRYIDGNGLRLMVRDTGARFWLWRYTIAGRTREMGLGRAGHEPGSVPLSEARQLAGELHRRVRAGFDPLADRDVTRGQAQANAQRQALAAITFQQVAASYIAAHRTTWTSKIHAAQWPASLSTYAYPAIGALPVSDVTTAHVVSVLEPIWQTKPETASRLRGRIEVILDFARVRDWRTGENPARWKGHLDHVLPARHKVAKVEHHAALPWAETPAFMLALKRQLGMAALALQFAILTAARTGEALGVRWSEVDVPNALWTVPGKRMKAKAEHRVPLSDAALALLKVMGAHRPADGSDGFVFPSSEPHRPLSGMAMLMCLRRMGRDDITTHGFRSSFRDWAAESTSYPRELAEAALAHAVGSKVEAAYQRGDLLAKRRDMMAAWSAFIERAPASGEVVPLRRGA